MGWAPFDILLLVGMVILGWTLFAGWLVTLVVRGAWRGLMLLVGMPRRIAPRNVNVRRCGRLRCRTLNPVGANYCRRCGSSLKGTVGQTRRGAEARAA